MIEPLKTEPFTYHCCFCKLERMSYWTPNPMFTLAKWQSKLACNRCADYHTERLSLCRKIGRICRGLDIARQIQSKEANALAAASDAKLKELTRKLAYLACSFLKLEMVWSEEFVELLLSKPDKCYISINAYLSGLNQLVKP